MFMYNKMTSSLEEQSPTKPDLGYIDGIYSNIVLWTVPFWHTIKFTPNMLTTLGLLCSILFIYFLWKRNLVLSLLFLFLRQYFDYADGLMARKYNQTSKFGDFYDHLSDTLFFCIPFLILLLFTKKRVLYLCLVIPAMLLAIMGLGCTEKSYHDQTSTNESPTLLFTENLCFNKEVLKIFDTSFMYIVIALVVIMVCLDKSDPKVR